MQKFAIGTAITALFAAGAIGLAGTTAAAPTGGSNAADTVKALRDMGYTVQLNGSLTGSLATARSPVSTVCPTRTQRDSAWTRVSSPPPMWTSRARRSTTRPSQRPPRTDHRTRTVAGSPTASRR